MRERLSRGKQTDNDTGEFVYGIPIEGEPLLGMGKETYIITNPGLQWVDGVFMTYDECIEVDPETVGDYTGLTDRNNKMIFEGDIVSIGDATGKIEYENGSFVYAHIGCSDVKINFNSIFAAFAAVMTIIGNIHDNPELIKKVKQNG